MTQLLVLIGAIWIFTVGTVVGSFVNVCIYRIPWQKSVIWPASHCPRCLAAIPARDNIPILGWLWLRGKCRACAAPISARYPLIEALVGLLFVALYYTDVVASPYGLLDTAHFLRLGYHAILVTLLVAATFIDYDLFVIPDAVTVPGITLGLLLGTLDPTIRPEPGTMNTALAGLWFGVKGVLVGGGLIWAIRIIFGLILRREAMGFGDVTLMAMIGAFLGWQPIVPTLFLGSLVGLIHAGLKFVRIVKKWVTRAQLSSTDREVPLGPYLSVAALILLLSWPWVWPRLDRYYTTVGEVVRFLIFREV